MISRTTIGRSFGGVVRYQFEGRKEQPSDKQAEVLAAVGVRADSAAHMSADFNRGRQLNPNLGQAVWHTSLSFNPDDAARLDSAKMLAIAEGYVQKMGLDKTQYAIIRHHDQPDNQHLHIIANRVGDDGQTIKDGHNFYYSKKALKELIQEHGLTPPQGLRVERQHEPSDKAELAKYEIKQALHQALATATDRPALLATLRAEKINAQEFTNKAGTVTGISFEKDRYVFKGSAVAREYSLAGLDKQLAANQVRQQAEQTRQAAAQEAAAQELRQIAVQLAHRQAAERQAAQLAQQQAANRQAVQRQEAERLAAQAAKVPELPAVERKWQAAYQQYNAGIDRQNCQHQVFNKLIDSYSEYLEIHPNEEGITAVQQAIAGDPHTVKLQADLARQMGAQTYYAQQWEKSFGQRPALEKQAEGNFFGKTKDSRAAEEKLTYLKDPTKPLPDLLQPALLEFARAAKAAQSAPVVGIEARTYYLPEVVGLSLAEYAAKQEAQRQLVVRISQPASEIKPTGSAEILQRTLAKAGAQVSMQHTTDAQGNRVSEVVVQYSVQQPRSEVKEISFVLDWATKQPRHAVQEREADRTQRQAFGQQDTQREQARSQEPRRGRQPGIG